MHSLGSLGEIELGDLSFSHHHPAHSCPDDHADAMGLFVLHGKRRIPQRFRGGDHRELRIPIHAFCHAGLEELCDLKIPHLSPDLTPIGVQRKARPGPKGRNARPSFQRGLLKLPHPDPARGYHPKPCNYYATYHSTPTLQLHVSLHGPPTVTLNSP